MSNRPLEAALTEAEREAVHVIVCGHDEPGRTKCPGGSLCCCEEVIAHMLATVSRIKAEAVQAERERIAGAIRGHNWRATHPEGEGYQYCRGFWAGIDCAALIAQGEGR